jgi:hypothetical protein
VSLRQLPADPQGPVAPDPDLALRTRCGTAGVTPDAIWDAMATHEAQTRNRPLARAIVATHATTFDDQLLDDLFVDDEYRPSRVASLLARPELGPTVLARVTDYFVASLPGVHVRTLGRGVVEVIEIFTERNARRLTGTETDLIAHLTSVVMAPASDPLVTFGDRRTAGRLLISWKQCPAPVVVEIAKVLYATYTECRFVAAHPNATRASWDALAAQRDRGDAYFNILSKEIRPLRDPDIRATCLGMINLAKDDGRTFLIRCIEAASLEEAPEYIRPLIANHPDTAAQALQKLPKNRLAHLPATDLQPLFASTEQSVRLAASMLLPHVETKTPIPAAPVVPPTSSRPTKTHRS